MDFSKKSSDEKAALVRDWLALGPDRRVDAEFARKVLGWQERADGWQPDTGSDTVVPLPPFTATAVVFVRSEHAYLCGARVPEMDALVRTLLCKRGAVLVRALLAEEPSASPHSAWTPVTESSLSVAVEAEE